ncbi:hypothetical protein PDESU_05082 [Pontiella desulfatans]|uniref:DUF350 domain-containing protein n=1 Tax=Pontiella desulfatans TaxID=2750659 RepID=A0A6C2UAE6_PONDE|nr:DUF350 domain-containing protein [Pontiella desulfatans]VGO16491.1 hypothetical protein PDESU_05082 [Pontiella desulfatans]
MIYLSWSLYAAVWLAVALVFLFVAKKLFDLLTPYSLEVQLTEKDNPAVGLVLGGFLLGVAAVVCGTFAGESGEVSVAGFAADIGWVAIYVVIGMVLLFFAGIVNDKLVLHRFQNQHEVVEERNMGVAAIVAATYLGSGLIVGGGISGSFSLTTAILPFIAGQIALVLFAHLYQILTKHDDLKEIGENKNVAAGVAYAGNILAYSIILMKGVSMGGEGIEMRIDRLWHFLYYAVAGSILLSVVRMVADRVFLPKARLHDEIVEDRNLGAGFIEAGLALATAAVLGFCL